MRSSRREAARAPGRRRDVIEVMLESLDESCR